MDGHGSYITANVIAYYMEQGIDLLILPPHTLHMLQPLDVRVFAPLKRALAVETDIASRLENGRVQQVEWNKMYIRAREKAITPANIGSGWNAAGIEPLSPITVLDKLATTQTPRPLPPRTPTRRSSFDLSLLHSSPPEGTELRGAIKLFHSQIHGVVSVPLPAKRYAKRMTPALETTQSTLITIQKELGAQRQLLQTRKTRQTCMRVKLKGRFVFITTEVLEIAMEAEKATAAKKGRKRPRERLISVEFEDIVESVLENVSSNSKTSCITVAERRFK